MATTSRTKRSALRRAVHLFVPTRRRAVVGLAVESAALLLRLPLVGHVAVAAIAHALIAAWPRRGRR